MGKELLNKISGMKHNFFIHKSIYFFILIHIIAISACSSPVANNSPKPGSGLSADMQLINKYSSDYFVGLGQGSSPTENVAMKIARATALGELSSNVKVFITSKLEIYVSESSSGESEEFVSQEIVEIGNAIIRSPEFEILSSNFNSVNSIFEIKVLAKKLKSEHYNEALKTIEIDDAAALIKYLEK